MKKLICVLLSLLLLLSLAACGAKQVDTPAPSDATPVDSTPAEDEKKPEEAFFFTYEGVKLTPATAFAPDNLPAHNDMYEVESCANQGTDNVYIYDTFELTAYNDGTGEVIYSIYLTDPDTATDEGLYVGDDLATVEKLYGTDYTDNDGELVYTKGNTELRILMEDDLVSTIEYRMVTE